MSLAKRKKQELSRKLESLEQELDGWLRLSEAKQPFEKHHSQIRRIHTQLRRTRASLSKKLDQYAKQEQLLTYCRQFEVMLLELHRVWDFFRSKLVQRGVDLFKPYLAAADEFAWACYKPAYEAARKSLKSQLKEPPLVFFSPRETPFVLARDSSYQHDAVPDSSLTVEELTEVLRAMPFSVVAVPWFQAEHLPDMLLVAHEVGHTVETDFELTDALNALVRQAVTDPERQSAWRAWTGELFADVYGVFSAGPAYASALIDFLAQDPEVIATEVRSSPKWTVYPTDHLRVVFTLEVLSAFGFEQASKVLLDAWRGEYPQQAMPEAFTTDAKAVAQALVGGKYKELGGKSLRELGCFSGTDHQQAVKISANLLNQVQLSSTNFRVMVAAARLAFAEDAAAYIKQEAQGRVMKQILKVREVGVRNSPGGEGAKEATALVAEDELAGDALFSRLTKLAGLPEEVTTSPGSSPPA